MEECSCDLPRSAGGAGGDVGDKQVEEEKKKNELYSMPEQR